jgi:hypothetical protein
MTRPGAFAVAVLTVVALSACGGGGRAPATPDAESQHPALDVQRRAARSQSGAAVGTGQRPVNVTQRNAAPSPPVTQVRGTSDGTVVIGRQAQSLVQRVLERNRRRRPPGAKDPGPLNNLPALRQRDRREHAPPRRPSSGSPLALPGLPGAK